MAFTNAWDEDKPAGTEDANLTDNYFQLHRADLGLRLEDMFFGFNISDNTGAEGEYGCKHLKLYPQTTPTTDSDYGFLYSKTVSSLEELHYKDGAASQTETQITSAGYINGAALKPDSVDSAHYAAASIDNEHLAADIITGDEIADDAIDSEHITDGSVDAVHIANLDPDAYAGEESVTLPNSLIIKMGYKARADTETTVTFGAAFPTAIMSAYATQIDAGVGAVDNPVRFRTVSTSALIVVVLDPEVDGFYWMAIGY